MLVSISGDVSPGADEVITDNLQAPLGASGILKVDVLGVLEREIRLEFNPDSCII